MYQTHDIQTLNLETTSSELFTCDCSFFCEIQLGYYQHLDQIKTKSKFCGEKNQCSAHVLYVLVLNQFLVYEIAKQISDMIQNSSEGPLDNLGSIWKVPYSTNKKLV